MNTKKADRMYNKDRIRRIKEASELAKQVDPNWHNNAPPSILPDENDDMPITQMRTPPFLKEIPHDLIVDNILSKKLTLNELTQCNKDSSQLQDIMHSSNQQINSNPKESTSVNYLEMSRIKKMKQRDDLNRQTSECLDRASEKWHYQLKEYSNKINTQDSTGVMSSLFSDDKYDLEKSEMENSEKKPNSRKVSGDIINRLDLLLQRGMRNSTMVKNISNLRNINERSYKRWSNRFNKSLFDLRYPLLSNSLGGNHFSHDANFITSKPDVRYRNITNPFNEYSRLHEDSTKYSNVLYNNLSNVMAPNLMNSNLCKANVDYPQSYNTSLNTYSQKMFPGQMATIDPSSFCAYSNVPKPIQSFPTTIWPNSFSNQFIQPQNSNSLPVPFNCDFHPNFVSSPLLDNPQILMSNLPQNLTANCNTTATNLDFNINFQYVTQKIDMLAKKLEVLNLTVDELKTVHSQDDTKSSIKTHKHVSISSPSEKGAKSNVQITQTPKELKLLPKCNCADCKNFESNDVYNFVDRKVEFEQINNEINRSGDKDPNFLKDVMEKQHHLKYTKVVYPKRCENHARSFTQFQSI